MHIIHWLEMDQPPRDSRDGWEVGSETNLERMSRAVAAHTRQLFMQERVRHKQGEMRIGFLCKHWGVLSDNAPGV